VTGCAGLRAITATECEDAERSPARSAHPTSGWLLGAHSLRRREPNSHPRPGRGPFGIEFGSFQPTAADDQCWRPQPVQVARPPTAGPVRESEAGTLHGTMSTVRKLVGIVLVAVALTFAACTTSTSRPTGVVTGSANACRGLAVSAKGLPPVTVVLYSGSRLITSETLPSGGEYRLTATPGAYTVKFRQRAGTRSFQPYRPKSVTVQAGRTVTANFFNMCM